MSSGMRFPFFCGDRRAENGGWVRLAPRRAGDYPQILLLLAWIFKFRLINDSVTRGAREHSSVIGAPGLWHSKVRLFLASWFPSAGRAQANGFGCCIFLL